MKKLEKSRKKPTRRAESVAIRKKVTAILINPEEMGPEVNGIIKIVVRNLK